MAVSGIRFRKLWLPTRADIPHIFVEQDIKASADTKSARLEQNQVKERKTTSELNIFLVEKSFDGN